MPFTQILLFLFPTLLLNLTPGPDMLFVLSRGLAAGRICAFRAVAGIGGGYCIHVLFVSFGVASLLQRSPVAFAWMKGIGAAYLAWMGFQAFRSKASGASSSEITKTPETRGGTSDIWRGFVVAVMNPKVVIFFLAYLPQFVRPEYGAPTKQLLVLGLTFCVSATTVNSGVAFMSSEVARWVQEKHQKLMNRICGGVMLGLAGCLLYK